MKYNCYLAILVGLVILGTLCIIISDLNNPLATKHKRYVISGNVTPIEDPVGERPEFVYVMFPYERELHLWDADKVEKAQIVWNNKRKGEYTVSFTLPLGFERVIFSSEPTLCTGTNVTLNKLHKKVDLKWGKSKCRKDELSENPQEVANDARVFMDSIEEDLVDKPLNETQTDRVKEDIERGRGEVTESSRENMNNKSLRHAYYAMWFANRAKYKSNLYELKHCITNITKKLSKHQNKCYVPNYLAYEYYKSANQSFEYFNSDYILEDYPQETRNLSKVKKEVQEMTENRDKLHRDVRKCQDAKRVIQDTFEFQEPYCTARKYSIGIGLFIWAIVFIYVGILMHASFEKWLRKRKKR